MDQNPSYEDLSLRVKELEAYIEQQATSLCSLFDNLPIGIVVTDPSGAIIAMNETYGHFIGYNQNELVSQKYNKIIASSEFHFDQSFISNLTKNAAPHFVKDVQHRHKNGHLIWGRLTISVTKDLKNEPQLIVICCENIEEQKLAKERLNDQFNCYQTLINTIPLPIFFKNTHGKYTGCNHAFESFIGRKKDNIIGKTVFEMAPIEIAQKYYEKDTELFKNPGKQEYEWTVVSKNKEIKKVIFHKATFEDQLGETIGLIGIISDITDQKNIQKKLIDYQDQLRLLSSEILLIEERERRFIASELHDGMGQELALLKMSFAAFLDVAEMAPHSQKLFEIKELINQIINNLRSLTFEISPSILYNLGLEAAIEWLIEKFTARYGIQFDFKYNPKGEMINEKIRFFLFRAVRELLINIIKHAKVKTALIQLEKSPQFITIKISDKGVGFNPGEIDININRMQRFGIFSIQERMKAIDGALVIKSTPGQGTTVTLLTPTTK